MTREEALGMTAEVLGIGRFSEDPVERVIQFAEHLPAIHGEAAEKGETLVLEEWERSAIEAIYGTLRDDGRRQYRTVYIEIPRKNGKSTFCAVLVLYALMVEQDPNGEVYSVAYTMKQAKIVFDAAANILSRLPEEFVSFERVYGSEKPVLRVVNPPQYGIIHHYPSGGKYEVLAANSASSYGYNPSMVIFDELHVQKSRDLWATMRTALGARREPLLVAITTAGSDRSSVCYQVRENALRIQRGEIENPTFLPVIYAADPDDDWHDREVWKKVNPALGSLKTWESMEEEYLEATQVPAAENEFKREHLNIWTEQSTRWLPVEAWMDCAAEIDLDKFEAARTPTFAGLDLSSTTDLSALALVFPDGRGGYDTWFRFWMPEDRVAEREKRDGTTFRLWVDQGWITATPGNVIDYDFIRRDLNSLGERLAFQEVGFDPWNATQLSLQLNGDGFTMVPMQQGHRTMNEPSKLFEALIVSRQIRHPNNPVMNAMVGNVEVLQTSTGAIRPVKPKDESRNVDGVVATVMGLGRASLHEPSTWTGEIEVWG